MKSFVNRSRSSSPGLMSPLLAGSQNRDHKAIADVDVELITGTATGSV